MPKSARRSTLRTVAVPTEHGAWGFLLEPALLALLLAPTWSGLSLALAALALVLTQHPLTLYFKDRNRGVRAPRTALAQQVALAYLAVALVLVLPLLLNLTPELLLWISIGGLLALIQLRRTLMGQHRTLLAEIAGAVALGALAPLMLALADWPLLQCTAVWLVLAARTVTSILYIRVRLRQSRGQATEAGWMWAAHGMALVLIAVLAFAQLLPWTALLALLLLLARAIHGLREQPIRAQVLGIREMIFGVVVVLLVASGYWWIMN